MKNNPNAFPHFYPDGVPPDDAVDANGIAYRIVREIPPKSMDFRSTYEDHLEQGKRADYGDSLWMACGTSLFKELEDSQKARMRYKPFRQRKIAFGPLASTLGKMKDTPAIDKPSHVTAWFYLDAKPHEHIKEDAEKGQ